MLHFGLHSFCETGSFTPERNLFWNPIECLWFLNLHSKLCYLNLAKHLLKPKLKRERINECCRIWSTDRGARRAVSETFLALTKWLYLTSWEWKWAEATSTQGFDLSKCLKIKCCLHRWTNSVNIKPYCICTILHVRACGYPTAAFSPNPVSIRK